MAISNGVRWSRGFLRAWVFASALWATLAIIYCTSHFPHEHETWRKIRIVDTAPQSLTITAARQLASRLDVAGATGAAKAYRKAADEMEQELYVAHRQALLGTAAAALIPPLLVLLFGAAIAWVLRGFRSEKPQDVG